MISSHLDISGAILDALFLLSNNDSTNHLLNVENTGKFSFRVGRMGKGWTPICHLFLQ